MMQKCPEIIEIVKDWIKNSEYDGLYCVGECACSLPDLFPCSPDWGLECCAGYEKKDVTGEYYFIVGPDKQIDIIGVVVQAMQDWRNKKCNQIKTNGRRNR